MIPDRILEIAQILSDACAADRISVVECPGTKDNPCTPAYALCVIIKEGGEGQPGTLWPVAQIIGGDAAASFFLTPEDATLERADLPPPEGVELH